LTSAPVPSADAIRSTWRWLAHGAHGVSEVRAIHPESRTIAIGFFDDEEFFVRECVRVNADANVYVGIQPRPRRLLELAPNRIRTPSSGASASDIEVVTATVLDLDPVRPKNTASTAEELQGTIAVAGSVRRWCEDEGLVPPRMMMSGNGAQLWFALPPWTLGADQHERTKAGLKTFEAEVRARFQTQGVHVDSIHDLARIIKVIGTVSHKGNGSEDRPHRVSVALDGFERTEDPGLRARIEAGAHAEPLLLSLTSKVALPVVTLSPSAAGRTKARRTAEGALDHDHPVEMCSPVQRLWEQGADDRSVALFNLVRFFAHQGLGLEEITSLITDYDHRKLGKLDGRDGAAYVRQCFDKIGSTADVEGSIAPPCRSLQEQGLCQVNRTPGARCDLPSPEFDIDAAIAALPADLATGELESRLAPILKALSQRSALVHGKYLDALKQRLNLSLADLRKALTQAGESSNAARSTGADDDTVRGEPADAIDGEIYEDKSACRYYAFASEGETKIVSSFTLQPTMRIASEDGELLLCSARTDKRTIIASLRLPLAAFHSKRDLIRHLPSADLQWTGSDNNVQGLLRVLARQEVARCAGSSMLGDYKKGDMHLWLTPEGAITRDGFLEVSPVAYIPSGASLDQRVDYRPTNEAALLKTARVVFENLLAMNKPEVILPILGCFFATPMKPRFMERVGSFPILFIWGSPGSGKSTMCMDVFWPLFGLRDTEPYSATETEFALLKLLSSTRSVPVFIDEYKPFDMQRHRLNSLHRSLRRIYRGETEERGRADQTLSSYHLQAPVCVAGETRPTEAALLERLLTSNPDKTTLAEHPRYKAAFRALKSVDLTLFAPRYIQFCLGLDFDEALRAAQALTATFIQGRHVPLRVADNVTAMLLGVQLFEKFAQACDCELPDDIGLDAAIEVMLADLVETEHGVKNALDHFIEMLGVMAIQGDLRYGVHYIVDGTRVAIHLESAYDSFRSHCKRIDYEGEMVDLKALRRLIQENKKQKDYVVEESDRVYFTAEVGRRRAFIIDLEQTKLVTVDDFPAAQAHPNC
jgi:hypothetical protein